MYTLVYALSTGRCCCLTLQVLRECHAAGAGSSGPLAGAMLWMLAAPEYPDYDGFTLHVTPQALHHAQQAAHVLCASLSSSMPGSSSAHAGAAAVGLAHHYHAHHAPMGFGGTDATKPDEDAQCLMQLAQYAVYCRLGSGRRGTGVSSGSGLQGTMPNTHELHPASAASCHVAMHIQQPHVPAAWAGPHATHAQGYGHVSDAAGSGCGSLVHALLQWLNDRR